MTSSTGTSSPNEDETRSKVYAVVGAMAPAGDATLADDTRLIADLAYDSLRLIELTLALEEGFGLGELAQERTATVTTLGDIVRLVTEARRETEAQRETEARQAGAGR
ncbi:phosphopantetheine-binding protein [Streptomyces rugosispiralis]|uniref:Phosphopantetheine-binding protein n=1 Tax=Streptomyces rugosispiralis TaxID=2967341 RepID=A0ABT1UT43_9ACTN|nr:phosphopantetheine-binding protein [Streptomyces rugosispiralis]MCQ8187501.1 phosphopantetheine-binding protein [Streptomyces rugosispiralis]